MKWAQSPIEHFQLEVHSLRLTAAGPLGSSLREQEGGRGRRSTQDSTLHGTFPISVALLTVQTDPAAPMFPALVEEVELSRRGLNSVLPLNKGLKRSLLVLELSVVLPAVW